MGIHSGISAGDGLKTAWTYSFGIILNDTTKIYRSSSPTEYWLMIGSLFVFCLVMLVVGPMLAIEIIKPYKKKRTQKKRDAAITK